MNQLFLILLIVCLTALLGACDSSNDSAQPQTQLSGEACFEGGDVAMGSTAHYPEEQPVRNVRVKAFCLDTHEVSVAHFEEFVQATGYKTVAETGPDPSDYPGQPPEYFQPGSAVFVFPTQHEPGRWSFSPRANWKDPSGTASSVIQAEDHPVTHIAFADAQHYAKWRGRRLPSEAEWELAAKSGGNSVEDVNIDGDKQSHATANIWNGEFPLLNTEADGYAGTAPVGSYPPDENGIYDLLGNVWEWTSDEFSGGHPTGSKSHVIKGGSHLCASNFCARFRPEARQPQEDGLGASHIGFRTARDASR